MKTTTKVTGYILMSIFCSLLSFNLFAQQDMLSELDKNAKDSVPDYVQATFKTTRNINVHTVEVLGKRTLDFRISHRFGEFESGHKNAYGIDGPANIRLGLEYSYDGRLMVGFGRSSYQRLLDGFLKYRLLRQTENNKMPVSVTLFTSIYRTNLDDPDKGSTGIDKYQNGASRLSYVHQIIIARKFTPAISFQLAPVMVHYNQVDDFSDQNDMYLISMAGRIKVTKRMALTSEYAFHLNDYSVGKTYYDPLSFGIDLETGGHVFQVHLTNCFGITDNQFYPYTTSSWKNKGFRLGFNVSRVFTL